MKDHVSYERALLHGIYIQPSFLICNHLIHSYSYTLLLNIFTILKWIIAYCLIYTGYLHSEPSWFTTVVSELSSDRAFGHTKFNRSFSNLRSLITIDLWPFKARKFNWRILLPLKKKLLDNKKKI
jgi:hypothetical protein